jgi:hypothetical protein
MLLTEHKLILVNESLKVQLDKMKKQEFESQLQKLQDTAVYVLFK